jgi:hypothetical protein
MPDRHPLSPGAQDSGQRPAELPSGGVSAQAGASVLKDGVGAREELRDLLADVLRDLLHLHVHDLQPHQLLVKLAGRRKTDLVHQHALWITQRLQALTLRSDRAGLINQSPGPSSEVGRRHRGAEQA